MRRFFVITQLGAGAAASLRGEMTTRRRALCHMRKMRGPVSEEELHGMGLSGQDIRALVREPALMREAGVD